MKKIFALMLVIAAVVACEKKEKEKPGPGPEPETPGVVATVTAPGGEMKAAWAEGDSFTAIQKTGNDSTFVTFKLVSGAGTAVGSFKAETETATEETVWTAVLGKRTSIVGSEIHCTYKGQDGKPASIDDYNYVIEVKTGVTEGKISSIECTTPNGSDADKKAVAEADAICKDKLVGIKASNENPSSIPFGV